MGIVWKLGLGLCEVHLGWFLIAVAVARGAPSMIPAVDPPPYLRAGWSKELKDLLAFFACGTVVGCELTAVQSCSVLLVAL